MDTYKEASSRPRRHHNRSENNGKSSSTRDRKPSSTSAGKSSKREHKSQRRVYLGMFKAKILVIGPCESGKTALSNFLADATETSGEEYHPTQGVRILEFESGSIYSGGRTVNCEVELWDCSGDHRFETCWPAFQKDTNGVLMVFNPDQPNHDKELETWYSHFVHEQGLRESQCMIFAHHKPNSSDKTRSQPPSALNRVPCIQTNLDEEPETVRTEFKNFLAMVISNWTDKRDQEELSIMNN